MNTGKCVLLDRDGVLNEERGDYVYNDEDFVLTNGVASGLIALKYAGFKLVVVTNQGGISKGLYTRETVFRLHNVVQKACGGLIDHIFYAPLHRDFTRSLASKPGSLMMERGLAITESAAENSWLVGDAERDMVAGKTVGAKTILIPTLKETHSIYADYVEADFSKAVSRILSLYSM